MNLLILTNNFNRASFRQRIESHLASLSNSGISCDVAKFSPGSFGRWKLFRLSSQYDAVFLHKKRLNSFDAFWLRKYARKVIYDFDDAVMYNDRSPELPSRKRKRDFARTVKLADAVIAGNKYLADHALEFSGNVKVLPTGLRLEDYSVVADRGQSRKVVLVWIGSKSTLKYLAEIKPALEEIASRFDNVVLRIICDEFFDLDNMEVEKRQWSRETQFLDLAESDIGLAPLPDNRFTRGKCGFKILQYAAAGLPVIASPVGVNAEYVSDGVTGLHAVSVVEWTEGISTMIKDSRLRRSMGLAGRHNVEKFDVATVGKQFYDIINNCLESSGSAHVTCAV